MKKNFKSGIISILLISLFACFISDPTTQAASPLNSFSGTVKKVNPSVVFIEVKMKGKIDYFGNGREVTGSGSGVIIDSGNGYVLTAAHVVKDAEEATVQLQDGREFEVVDIRSDPQTDVAIVQIEAEDLKEVPLGDSDELEVGDWVLAMGSPLGKVLANSVSAGIVSGKGRRTRILGGLGIEDYIQTDAVINKGNSGGPLVNTDGEIVGINSSIISSTGMSAGLGFAVPSNLIKPVIKDLIETGEVVRGWIGVSISSIQDLRDDLLENVPEELIERGGAYIVETMEDGPAAEAGLESGDIITSINDEDVLDSSDLIKIVSAMKPDDKVEVEYYRDGNKKTERIKLGTRPGSGDSGAYSKITNEDRQSAAYKKIGIVVEDFEDRMIGPRGAKSIKGLKVTYVKSGSLGMEFGITAEEVITEVDGKEVENKEDFNKLIDKADIDDGIVLTVYKDGSKRKVIIMDID